MMVQRTSHEVAVDVLDSLAHKVATDLGGVAIVLGEDTSGHKVIVVTTVLGDSAVIKIS
jgi:hypothetical protein